MRVNRYSRKANIIGIPEQVEKKPLPECLLEADEKAQFDPIIKDGKYMPIRVLGKGTFGLVVEACHQKSGKLVAIKRIANFDDWEYSMV